MYINIHMFPYLGGHETINGQQQSRGWNLPNAFLPLLIAALGTLCTPQTCIRCFTPCGVPFGTGVPRS